MSEKEAERKRVLDAYIKRTVDDWPPLTAAQRDRLTLLLRPKHPETESIVDEMANARRRPGSMPGLTNSLLREMDE